MSRQATAGGGGGGGERRPQPFLTAQVVQRFLRSIAERLEEEPLELDIVEHRRQVGRLLRRHPELNHYELLDLPVGATAAEVQGAYEELARRVHPSHAGRLGLEGTEARLVLLFERLTEAYLTLSDPERSRQYTLALPVVPRGRSLEVSDAERRVEQERMARERFQIALGMVAHEEYHSAIQILEQAVLADPQAEYYELLGTCQARNPRWLSRAIASFESALELQPDDDTLRLKLADLLDEVGNEPGARAQREAAAKTLGAARAARRRGSLMARLRAWLRRG